VTRSFFRSSLAVVTFSFAGSVVGCSGPPVPSSITGEPVCADYSIGAGGVKLRGGLRFPVRVTIVDDDDPVAKVLVFGKHAESDPNPRLVLPDKNAEYKVEWSQCANERATTAVNASKAKSLRTDSSMTYDCGEATPYKTATLVTKKGDRASHALAFEAPPKPDCWMDTKPVDVADAGAPDAAAPVNDVADAGDSDADVTDGAVVDAETPDANALDASSGDAAPAKKTDNKPADKPAEKSADKPADVKADQPVK
jgi:hypothetical protein